MLLVFLGYLIVGVILTVLSWMGLRFPFMMFEYHDPKTGEIHLNECFSIGLNIVAWPYNLYILITDSDKLF
jgi:hypothetical protein